jgi:iron complex outermembrane recepter protein
MRLPVYERFRLYFINYIPPVVIPVFNAFPIPVSLLSNLAQMMKNIPFALLIFCNWQNVFAQVPDKDTAQLGAVIVRGRKPLIRQEPYGMVVNVESSMISKGSSALAVLEQSPGVVIDHRNYSIALNGKSGVMVMLDGKLMRMPVEQVMALLNGMSADDIEKIELITTPPAKYDAEGSAGLINIVLKKNSRPGTNGSFSLTGGYGKGGKGTGSINLAHNKKNVNMYGSYTFSHDRSYDDLSGSGTQDFPPLGGQMAVQFWNSSRWVHNNHDATAGIDIKLHPKSTIGAGITYNSGHSSSSSFNRRIFDIYPDSLLLSSGIISGINRWENMAASLYMENTIREGKKINFDMDYLYYKNNSPTDIQSSFLNREGDPAKANDTLLSPGQRGISNSAIHVGVIKTDYARQWSKKLKVEAGAKGSFTHNASLSGIGSLVNGAWISRTETTNDIIMNEAIGAAYASLSAQLNSSTTLFVGARYEYAHTHMDNPATKQATIDRHLGTLFPNLFLSRRINDHADWQLSYTRRISRPSYDDLSSFIAYNDLVSVLTGNPLLKPTISGNVKLGFNYHSFSFSILAGRDDDPIARWQITAAPAGNLMYISPQNLTWQKNLTLQANLPWKVNSWCEMNYSLVGGWRRFREDFTVLPAEKTYFSYSINFSEYFKAPGNFLVGLSGWYNAASYNGTVRNGGTGTLNAGIKKELKNKGGTFQLTVADLLRTIHYDSDYGTFTEDAFSAKSHVTYNPESRRSPIIKLTYSRSFGNSNVKGQRKQESGPEDERNRIR